MIFGRFDADRMDDFVRYPCVIRLDNYNLTIQLPTRAKSEENRDREIRFVGAREYILKSKNSIHRPHRLTKDDSLLSSGKTDPRTGSNVNTYQVLAE